jgi:hypothetical protein
MKNQIGPYGWEKAFIARGLMSFARFPNGESRKGALARAKQLLNCVKPR